MKKLIVFTVLTCMTIGLLAGCGKDTAKTEAGSSAVSAASGAEEKPKKNVNVDKFTTIGDAIEAHEEGSEQTATYDNTLVYVCDINGTIYRFRATIDEKSSEAFKNIDISKESYTEAWNRIASDLKIDQTENLTEQIPSQEDLDKLVGKTGAELLDDGWSIVGYTLQNMAFYMNKSPFEYNVIFDAEYSEDMKEDFQPDEFIGPLSVKSVEYARLGDATNIEPPEKTEEATEAPETAETTESAEVSESTESTDSTETAESIESAELPESAESAESVEPEKAETAEE